MKRKCRKGKRYRDELGAKFALASTYRAGTPSRREEKRFYQCTERNGCGGWHLTSQDKHEKVAA
jgi:hypothetical protein